jgi:plasmid stabilization system protein ParE
MDFKVTFRDTFIDDLSLIVRAIARHNPIAAHRLGEKIIASAEKLNFFPERYPRLRQRPRIRRFIVRKHFKVFYRINYEQKSVEVLRCWDGRRAADPSSYDQS